MPYVVCSVLEFLNMVILNPATSAIMVAYQPCNILELRGFPNARVSYIVDFGVADMVPFCETFEEFANVAQHEELQIDDQPVTYKQIDSFFDSARGEMVIVYSQYVGV